MNTMLLYVRMLFTMGLAFFATRSLLDVLGASDFGLVNVIAGVVSLFSFLSGSMNAATSRFFSFELGRKDDEKLAQTFSMMCVVFAAIVLAIVILSEIVGIWVIEHKLVIPADRMNAALWLFQGALLSFVASILTMPYSALVISRENMKKFSLISIADACMKLAIVLLLYKIPSDRLPIYGGLLFVVSLCTLTAYCLACRRYPESRFHFFWDKARFRELISYSGWNLFGGLASTANGILVNILLNMFFGLVVNAARGVAYQVSSAVSGFTSNFMQAVNPQIVKYYAGGETDQMKKLVCNASRYAFLLIFIGVLPLFWKTAFVLDFWLKEVPENTVLFVRLVLLATLADSYSNPLSTGIAATGRIALYQIVVGTLYILNFPISLIFLELGFGPEVVFYIAIAISCLALAARLLFLRAQIGLSLGFFSRHVLFPTILLMIAGVIAIFVLGKVSESLGFPDIVQLLSGIAASCLLAFLVGLDKKERGKAFDLISRKVLRR
jgi:O-antigen/teichoic acid export membrane protein